MTSSERWEWLARDDMKAEFAQAIKAGTDPELAYKAIYAQRDTD